MNKIELLKRLPALIAIFTCLFLICLTHWLLRNYSGLSLEVLIFNLHVPLKGAPSGLITSFIIYVILLPITILFGVILLQINCISRKIVNGVNISLKRLNILAVIILLITLIYMSFKINYRNFFDYVFSRPSSLYENYYIDPKSTLITFPEDKNNLILIYLESMETSYQSIGSCGDFNKNLIPELTKLANDNINFSSTKEVGGAAQVFGTGWTMAAAVASSSGLPLKLPIFYNDISNDNTFLPYSIALGDILRGHGYLNLLMCGDDAVFSGTDTYYQSHGSYHIMDSNYFGAIGEIPQNYLVESGEWGFKDSKLYELAKKELAELSKSNQQFNLTMFTIDTHPPFNSNTISTASEELYGFVKWIQAQSFYKKTTIVILGDHISSDPVFFREINLDQRKIFNVIINSRVAPYKPKNREFCTFDFFPTIIESIGGKINAEGLGLGRSLFGANKTLIEKLTINEFNRELRKNSNTYDALLFGKKSSAE